MIKVKEQGQIHRADAWRRASRPDNLGEIPSAWSNMLISFI